MSINPLKALTKQATEKKSVREWIERGNRILWGLEPTSKGDTLPPRYDLEWVHRNGSYSIEPIRRSDAQVDRSPEGGDPEDGRHSRERGREAMRP